VNREFPLAYCTCKLKCFFWSWTRDAGGLCQCGPRVRDAAVTVVLHSTYWGSSSRVVTEPDPRSCDSAMIWASTSKELYQSTPPNRYLSAHNGRQHRISLTGYQVKDSRPVHPPGHGLTAHKLVPSPVHRLQHRHNSEGRVAVQS
jgi:hypothetical protein